MMQRYVFVVGELATSDLDHQGDRFSERCLREIAESEPDFIRLATVPPAVQITGCELARRFVPASSDRPARVLSFAWLEGRAWAWQAHRCYFCIAGEVERSQTNGLESAAGPGNAERTISRLSRARALVTSHPVGTQRPLRRMTVDEIVEHVPETMALAELRRRLVMNLHVRGLIGFSTLVGLRADMDRMKHASAMAVVELADALAEFRGSR